MKHFPSIFLKVANIKIKLQIQCAHRRHEFWIDHEKTERYEATSKFFWRDVSDTNVDDLLEKMKVSRKLPTISKLLRTQRY